jgi:homoserine kinase
VTVITSRFSVRVPATSANLGPGFDCLGLAVTRYLTVSAELSDRDSFHYSGPGTVANTADNLTHQGFRAAFAALGQEAPAVRFTAHNTIPLARGLGSSSAALVAGAALADAFLGGSLGREGVFQLTAQLEGHPDNVAPAVFGGFTVSAKLEEGYLCQPLPLPGHWHLLFAIPTFELLTREARAVLPERYSRADAIYNASRTALWTTAVALDKPALLRAASQDRLHEPYREGLIPGLAAHRQDLLAAGACAAFLSGAGPTLAAISTDDATTARLTEILQRFAGEGEVLELRPSEGYLLELDSSNKLS